jgi:hypothetical protein
MKVKPDFLNVSTIVGAWLKPVKLHVKETQIKKNFYVGY